MRSIQRNIDLKYKHVAFLICPTGRYCREDRCQSFFKFELIPSMRAPLEECEAAGAVLELGAQASLIDAPAENINFDKFLLRIKETDANLFIIVITFGSLEQDLICANKIKEVFPNIKIGLRGTPCYVDSENILRNNSFIDFCIRGEYESIFSDILKNDYKNSLGVIYLEENKLIVKPEPTLEKDLDLLPLPNREIINNSLYKVRLFGSNQATIRVQRGCPYSCTYCLVHTVSGNKARHRSPESIAKEMQALIESGINYFYLRADTFSLEKLWVLEVCKEIKDKCPTAKWVTTTRVERVDEEIISAMKDAGCYGISFGLDVGSKFIAAKVLKKINYNAAKEAFMLCDKYNILSLAYIMIGFIWDTMETLKETKNFVLKLFPDLITIHFAHPYPGTVYHRQTKELSTFKLINQNQAQATPAIETENITEKILKNLSREILFKHYIRPRVLIKIIKKIIKQL